MFKTESIKNYIKDDILTTLFQSREDEIVENHIEQEENLKEIYKKHPTSYQMVIDEIEKLDGEKASKIKNMLKDYLVRNDLSRSYENEKFYKVGFVDGVRLIEENKIKEKSNQIEDTFLIPYYLFEEIVEYIELTAKGECKSMKWENIRSLLKLAKVNGRITKEQAKYIEQEYNREQKRTI